MTTTLFDKIGGRPAIENLVAAFYGRVLTDPLLAPFFEQSDMEKLKKMQLSFFSIALGAGEPEAMPPLREAHQNRGIETKHLTRFTELLLETLNAIGISESDASKIYERVATYSNEVLGESNVDG